jgi:hypothetical protein
VLENQVALVAPENQAVPAVRVASVGPENPVDQAVPENPAGQAVRVALAVLENQAVLAVLAVRVARAALENPVVPAALARQVVAALPRQAEAVLVSQVEAAEKEEQTRSVDISRRGVVAAVAPSLAAVGALLKPRAAEVAVA